MALTLTKVVYHQTRTDAGKLTVSKSSHSLLLASDYFLLACCLFLTLCPAAFEDGTINFLSLPAVEIGLRHIERIGIATVCRKKKTKVTKEES